MIKKVIASAFLYYYALFVNCAALIMISVLLIIFVRNEERVSSIAGAAFLLFIVVINVFFVKRVLMLNILKDGTISFRLLMKNGVATCDQIDKVKYLFNNIACLRIHGVKYYFLGSKDDADYLMQFVETSR